MATGIAKLERGARCEPGLALLPPRTWLRWAVVGEGKREAAGMAGCWAGPLALTALVAVD